MSSIRSIFGTILNRSAHDAYRARYMLQQQWRSITDATLQQCAERRIALIKENSQVKKNNFSKKIAQTGSRHTAEESADDSPVRKIIFFRKRQNWESIHRKEFAEISRTRKHGKIRKKEKNQRKTNCHRLQFTDMHSAPSSRLRQCTPVSRETGIRTCHSGSQKSKGDTTVHKHTVG
jgi:hypothetical protein